MVKMKCEVNLFDFHLWKWIFESRAVCYFKLDILDKRWSKLFSISYVLAVPSSLTSCTILLTLWVNFPTRLDPAETYNTRLWLWWCTSKRFTPMLYNYSDTCSSKTYSIWQKINSFFAPPIFLRLVSFVQSS